MNAKVAMITGYAKDPEFVKILLLSLNNQTLQDFDCYIYASPASLYYLDESFIKPLKFKCYHLLLEKNNGFAGNNNYAIETAFKNKNYEHAVLVNDDTIPDENWLKELVKTAESSKDIGAVTSKMVFYQKFVTVKGVTLSAAEGDNRLLGVRLYANTGFSGSYYPKKFYKDGFYALEEDEINPFKWTYDKFTIELPVNTPVGDNYKLKLFVAKNPTITNQVLTLVIGDYTIENIILQSNKICYEVLIPISCIEKNWHYIIQNTGSEITPDHSHEIGFGEIDKGQYDTEREVSLFCGGACLLTKKALLETGLFMEGLFNYYEDSDLSMRMKKKGYKIIYSPKALIKHFHTGTSKEWSPFFTYYAFRNKIIFSAKTFGVKAFKNAFSERGKETFMYFKLYTKSRFKNQELKSRTRFNLIILKDSLIGIVKFKPKNLPK